MRYSSKEESQNHHIEKYRSDGVQKGKGTLYASDYERVQFLVQHTPKDSLVLDVGCNGGTVGVHLLKRGCYVKGIDIVEELVSKAVKRGIYAEVGEAEDLSRYKSDSFDVVICSEVLEHLYDPLEAIKEAYRVLKSGGIYIVTVPHVLGEMCASDKLGDYHQANYSPEILDTMFHLVFERGKVDCANIPYSRYYCAANNIDPLKPQWFGVIAKK